MNEPESGGGWNPERGASGEVSDWTEICMDIVGADGGAVVIAPEAASALRRVVHVSDEVAGRVADTLYLLGTRPDHDPDDEAAVVTVVSVADAVDRVERPLLVDELVALGVDWLHLYPLRASGAMVGMLILHRRRRRGVPQQTVASAFVEQVARVLGAYLVGTDKGLSDWAGGDAAVQRYVDSADTVNIAVGILIARHGVDSDAASALLRASAYARGSSSAAEAQRIIDSLSRPDTP